MKKVTPEEIRALLSKDGPTRYSYFVKQVADTEQVWGLREPDGWVSVSDDSEIPMLPVWPHRESAELLVNGTWASASPTPIDLYDWLEEWLPNLAADGDMVAVFPTPVGKGVVVDPAALKADLERETSRYE